MAEDQVLRGTKRKHPADGTEAACNEPYSSAVRKIDQERCHYDDPGLTNGNYCTGQQQSSEETKGQHLQLLSHAHGDPVPDSLNLGGQRDKSLTKEEDTEVCFGSICDIHARFIDGPPSNCNYLSANAVESDEEKLEVLLGSEYCVICSPLRDGIIGFINLGVSNILKRLFEIEGTRLEISLSLSEWKSGTQRHSSIAWETNVEIAIFGARKNAFLVGDCLSSGTLFLQDPNIPCDLPYENPHRFPFVGDFQDNSDNESSEVDDNDTLSINKLVPTSAKISTKRLEHIMDTLHEHDYLQEVQPDKNLNISLFSHQKEAIDFMIRRETGRSTSSISLWNIRKDKNGNPHHYHAITGDSSIELPVGPLGGILADTMGLGKTVTTLSTILSTLGHSEEWVKKRTNSQVSGTKGTKATLIVVPNEALMEQWLDEIRSKFKPGTFEHCKYHGPSRKASIHTFEEFDIVLTTYGTISTEFAEKESPIYQTDFFRIVLDEAHNIKSRFTRIHEAACNISADRRWCLTGTPIQNDLDDLGALVSFLRVPLLEKRGVFRNHIIKQAYNIGSDRFENVRLLLGFICLRRSMSLGMLVKPTIINLELNLAPEEREAYINILDYHNRLIDLSVSKGGSVGAFQTVLQLRIFCNNGLYRKKDIRASPTDLLTSEEYLDFLQENHGPPSLGTDNETLLLGSYEISDSKTSHESSNSIGEACRISLQSRNMLDLTKIEGPTSELLHSPNLFRESLTPDYLSLVDQSPQALEGTFSTKHQAILKTILGHVPQEKGIVFSAWTKSLDIMAELLRQYDITFARVDGSMSFSQRQQASQSFKTNSDVNILLMTIGTGAVGLNLSIATRVHIMEPSWNPMVEQQAIGRVVRLGQKRPVVITRYIMRDTVEESVVSRQDLKLDVAMSGFEGSSHGVTGDAV
ncbi:helicase [Aspergillus eucalypticola CBS 122712]|uniref:Helicase n=1 Tax=Aspergillus eucalypticola (strain CBS 122712 / IBT 29274) TaxID=1448314 RepID=A0A317VEM3_ASPEC|nr:helicase [Aspergillus eucalypticola CBS 122712]PWY71402.1 helicase [Aspergillus eucalypticola CBS 122712]